MNDQTQWDNSHIFKDLNDPKILETFEMAKVQVTNLEELVSKFQDSQDIKYIINALNQRAKVIVELQVVSTYLSSLLSVNAKDEAALKIQSKLSMLWSELFKVTTPVDNFVLTCEESQIQELLKDDELSHREFSFKHSRKNKDFILSKEEESLMSGLSTYGLDAWGKLYSSISGTMQCEIDSEVVGYSQAASNLRKGDAALREKSWRAIQNSWRAQEQSAAAILNAINGWRNENFKLRSKKAGRPIHALDEAVHSARISRKTLDALMDSTYKKREVGQRALLAMAKSRGDSKASPWDLLAPAPSKSKEESLYSFTQGMNLIIEAFNSFSTEMGDFAKMMWEKNWIDALPTPARKPGAYCTKFIKQREPRVFITYNGSMGDVITLAHELGHAFHNWVMKDLHIQKISYPMTLAETASIFAETLVRDYLYDHAKTDEEKFEICWEDASSAEAMLCNIPARFEFEKSLVQAREVAEQTPRDLRSLMSDSWKKWYENSLTEYDEMFWASKLHFSISGLSFYNYPYLFGYLFSLGIYAQKEKMGKDFYENYKNILLDTGVMSAEDLIKKHLGSDIESDEFWLDSLSIVEKAVTRFEKLV